MAGPLYVHSYLSTFARKHITHSKYVAMHNQLAPFTSFPLQVDPNFLNGFLESSVESLRMSTDKEINGIINRDELIDRLVEKKRKIEKMLKVIMLGVI